MNKILRKVLIVSIVSAIPSLALADYTAEQYLYEINVDAVNSTYYFRAAAAPGSTTAIPWGVSACPNATYAYARQLPLLTQVYGTALAAQLAGKPVMFAGTCDPDGQYFRITHIIARG